MLLRELLACVSALWLSLLCTRKPSTLLDALILHSHYYDPHARVRFMFGILGGFSQRWNFLLFCRCDASLVLIFRIIFSLSMFTHAAYSIYKLDLESARRMSMTRSTLYAPIRCILASLKTFVSRPCTISSSPWLKFAPNLTSNDPGNRKGCKSMDVGRSIESS